MHQQYPYQAHQPVRQFFKNSCHLGDYTGRPYFPYSSDYMSKMNLYAPNSCENFYDFPYHHNPYDSFFEDDYDLTSQLQEFYKTVDELYYKVMRNDDDEPVRKPRISKTSGFQKFKKWLQSEVRAELQKLKNQRKAEMFNDKGTNLERVMKSVSTQDTSNETPVKMLFSRSHQNPWRSQSSSNILDQSQTIRRKKEEKFDININHSISECMLRKPKAQHPAPTQKFPKLNNAALKRIMHTCNVLTEKLMKEKSEESKQKQKCGYHKKKT